VIIGQNNSYQDWKPLLRTLHIGQFNSPFSFAMLLILPGDFIAFVLRAPFDGFIGESWLG